MNPYAKTFTVAAALTTGYAENVTGATWVIATPTGAADDLAHLTTIKNDAATDHSAKTAVITGTDAMGLALTETLNLPGVSATVTGVKYFKTVTSVVPSATIGADTMDIGYAAASVTPWVTMDYNQASFSATWAVQLVSGVANFSEQHTYDVENGDAAAFGEASLAGLTASTDAVLIGVCRAVRVKINSHTAGVFKFHRVQGANC